MAIKNPKSTSSLSNLVKKTKRKSLVQQTIIFFQELTELSSDLDREGTILNIQNNKRMKGANAWLLMCSIMVASLGLNLNSPAVIIGAMLISPLMSPILGIGLSVGINDKQALLVSFRHFGISIAIALITSYLYFSLTPLDQYTSEIDARTEPTFLDVLIAFFGGLAGIISGSRKDKSNAIPGVAIATALMPPLCVTGYGLAHQEIGIILNSFYLFFLNATFVALATYLIVRFLNFPKRKYEKKAERIRTQWILGIIATLIMLPSIYIFSGVLNDVRNHNNVKNFAIKNFPQGIVSIDKIGSTDSVILKVFVLENLSNKQQNKFNAEFTKLNAPARLVIVDAQESGLSKEEFERKKAKLEDDHLTILEREKIQLAAEKDHIISVLNVTIDSMENTMNIFKSISNELKVLFPEIEEVRYAPMQRIIDDPNEPEILHTYMLHWEKGTSSRTISRNDTKIALFLKERTKIDTVSVVAF